MAFLPLFSGCTDYPHLQIPKHFGLLDTSDNRWQTFKSKIEKLDLDADEKYILHVMAKGTVSLIFFPLTLYFSEILYFFDNFAIDKYGAKVRICQFFVLA
jgi:hypothetical protein